MVRPSALKDSFGSVEGCAMAVKAMALYCWCRGVGGVPPGRRRAAAASMSAFFLPHSPAQWPGLWQ